jgi:aldoxime dehydratase
MHDITLEAAIPSHLQVKRTRQTLAPKGLVPQHPSYSARFDPSVKGLTMAYFGVQYRPDAEAEAQAVIAALHDGLAGSDGSAYWDAAREVDEAGYVNHIAAAYWTDPGAQPKWEAARSNDWWHKELALDGAIGAFREVYRPSLMDSETTFTHPYPEGYSKIAAHMSGATDTHEYWGASRDRIPRSQVDAMEPQGVPHANATETHGRLVVVEPHGNLCLLRSGQDWTITEAAERAFYLEKVRPYLDAGMAELKQPEGLKAGCYFNRYVQLQTPDGPIEKTYSLSAWHSLVQIEQWVQTETHLAIFGAGIKHYKNAGENARLRLYHEMSVLKATDQSFTYFNCHPETGMLRALKARAT